MAIFVTEYQMDATRMHFHKFITFTLLGPSSEKRFDSIEYKK